MTTPAGPKATTVEKIAYYTHRSQGVGVHHAQMWGDTWDSTRLGQKEEGENLVIESLACDLCRMGGAWHSLSA